MRSSRALKIAAAVLLCEAAGLIGSVFTASSVSTWYATLTKPFLTPPSWAFGPVWTTLYALMGIAAFLVWEKTTGSQREERFARGLFLIQLGLNIAWSFLFFSLENPGLAFAEILLMLAAIVATIVTFRRISRPAAWLLVPYLAWTMFAAYLNFSLWILNK